MQRRPRQGEEAAPKARERAFRREGRGGEPDRSAPAPAPPSAALAAASRGRSIQAGRERSPGEARTPPPPPTPRRPAQTPGARLADLGHPELRPLSGGDPRSVGLVGNAGVLFTMNVFKIVKF